MKFLIIGTFLITITIVISPFSLAGENNDKQIKQNNWRAELAINLPVLGHRNFIVIADSAYPMQSNPGIKTIYTGEQQIVVVKEVIAAIENATHVNGTIYVDKELYPLPFKMREFEVN